jgi:ketosteroid isomerase-like protein
MKSLFLSLMLVFAISTSAITQTAAGSDDSKDAAAVASKLFAAMRAKDAVAIRALFTPEGQLVAVDKPRDGQGLSKTRVFTADAFAKLIAEAKGEEFIETMAQPEVKLFGDMAIVFGRYTFYVGDKFSHCGTNSFHLVRTADGWKIANAASTLEFVCGQNTTSSANEKSARRTLNIYFIDVEGGAATLIVTPAGESVLIDAGWDGANGRDARRIQQAMQQAGVTEIDAAKRSFTVTNSRTKGTHTYRIK